MPEQMLEKIDNSLVRIRQELNEITAEVIRLRADYKYSKSCNKCDDNSLVKDIHTEHCCIMHGCKYGEEKECTVYLGSKKQSLPCLSTSVCYDLHPDFRKA